ncbi:protease inhibitor I42 family protein [Legionella maioricensis]|uniref:Protease inhibitor I42 family protein n=1 Tax=Legionella maioricensis TaxID=2896528 RepID=A0A9X2ICU8_9GAMM|nr:protease inhibitor I42 family protein [Legionella maioricensis]MCL9685820.1 protease inhibitor I42 family protein [Legionella maioricensis]MCL9689267.1 protease inhibitor I42 family protein [Legionella maioricensis]
MNILLGCVLLGLSIIANAGSAAGDDLTINADSSQSSFVVQLAANPTTGFQWKVVRFDKNLLSLISSHYQKNQTNLIGAGGQMQFTFILNKGKSYPAKTNMVFKYARSWEPDTSTLKKVTVNFVKAPNS